MPRLMRINVSRPGLGRVRGDAGFSYVDAASRPVSDTSTLARIATLVIPPAWEDVWICPTASGHIQATGVDARGRRQYRYHDQWRVVRDLAKHERVLDFAMALPAARQQVVTDLADRRMTRPRALACAVRLLDLGFFRVGSEQYAEQNQTYGLATVRREHVSIARDGVITFDYLAKGSKQRVRSIADPAVLAAVGSLKRRRGGGPELLAWRDGETWKDIKSGEINDYLRVVTGGDYSAKDFRTWNATVLAAVGLAVSIEAATSPTARRRAVTRVVKEVATYLGNTPTVCRSSYIDPRVIDLYESGVTIADDLERLGADATFGQLATQGQTEAAVLGLLRDAGEQADGVQAAGHPLARRTG